MKGVGENKGAAKGLYSGKLNSQTEIWKWSFLSGWQNVITHPDYGRFWEVHCHTMEFFSCAGLSLGFPNV